MKLHPCKVGTITTLIQLRYKYNIELNKEIEFRFENEFTWRNGLIWKVNEDGYFFVKEM